MSGLFDIWLAARKRYAEWRAERAVGLAAAWTRTAKDCLERIKARKRCP